MRGHNISTLCKPFTLSKLNSFKWNFFEAQRYVYMTVYVSNKIISLIFFLNFYIICKNIFWLTLYNTKIYRAVQQRMYRDGFSLFRQCKYNLHFYIKNYYHIFKQICINLINDFLFICLCEIMVAIVLIVFVFSFYIYKFSWYSLMASYSC